jgi:Domain of unknown function (DUF4278)
MLQLSYAYPSATNGKFCPKKMLTLCYRGVSYQLQHPISLLFPLLSPSSPKKPTLTEPETLTYRGVRYRMTPPHSPTGAAAVGTGCQQLKYRGVDYEVYTEVKAPVFPAKR